MATHKSALKRHRQSIRRRERNRASRAAVRTAVKTALASAEQKKEDTVTNFRKAQTILARAANKRRLHWRTAARKTSRLAKAVARKSK